MLRSRTTPYRSSAATGPGPGPGPATPSVPTNNGQPKVHANAQTSSSSSNSSNKFPRISRPVELMRNSYDCIVIGSGYGGGVAASRMARAGQSVCLLELGKERWPGEYPTSSGEVLRELHCSGEVAPPLLSGIGVDTGPPTGMYHLVFGKGQNAVVGHGLGGTSLMNANVFLRADDDTMAMKAWPPELREKGALDEYYKKVEQVLEPEEYPADWPTLPKLDLLQKQAGFLNMQDKFYRPKQTTRFHDGPNSTGVEMSASTLSGQDCTGLNDGSKMTTLVTYLTDAWNWGAELFCECEVRYIEKARNREGGDDGYRVYFAWHGSNRGRFRAYLHDDLMWVHARSAVFLGAGALGTTEILLRSRARKSMGGLCLSDQVGQNMSGNGDLLAFGYNTNSETNALGQPFPSPYQPVGPTIAGVIDNRTGHANPLDGYVLEEGAVPQALVPFLQAMLELMPAVSSSVEVNQEERSVLENGRAALARWGSRLLGPYFRKGAVEHTQVYLIMSHDSNQAVLSLEEDKPVLEFLGVGRSDHVKYLNRVLAKATQAVGGQLVQNPFFALMKQEVTVHPIGGASMSPDNSGVSGATDHVGRLFSGNGSEVHAGLIVTDGAAVPTALGVNPLATIAALAERSVEFYARSRGLVVRTDSNGLLNLFGAPEHPWSPKNRGEGLEEKEIQHQVFDQVHPVHQDLTEDESVLTARSAMERAAAMQAGGFGFTEVMSGFLHRYDEEYTVSPMNPMAGDNDDPETYRLAHQIARSKCESARFFLTFKAVNIAEFVHEPEHRGMLTGTFVCPTLPGSPFVVSRGVLHLLVLDHKAPGTRNLIYDFDLHGTNGDTLHFHGYKVVNSSVALAPLRFWQATTTLYVTITKKRRERGSSDSDHLHYDRPVAKGIMNIQLSDFLSQVLTLTPTGSGLLRKIASTTSFLTYFTCKSLGLFLTPLARLQYPAQPAAFRGYINYTPPTHVWTDIRAADGVCTRLYVWDPLPAYVVGGSEDGRVPNLLMIPGASVDHQIFATPTIPFNAVNYFNRAGYRVFVCVHRIGQLKVAQNNWTTYDARLDICASFERIRAEYGPEHKIYTIAHCMGSVALAAGMLDGTIPADWLLGLSCSQTFMNPIWQSLNMIKASAGPIPLDTIYSTVAGPWFDCTSQEQDPSLVQRLLNQALRLWPDTRGELCNSAACHRISLVFGRCWNHANLNEATHRHIDRFFSGVNMTLLHLLMRQGSEGHILANGPLFEVLTTPENVRKHIGGQLPIFLFVGRDNAVLSPRATEKTYEILCDTFGQSGQNGHETMYRRRVIPGYGHLDCWMGRNAWRDVFPIVRAEVDRVVHSEAYRFQEPGACACRFTRMMEAGEL
ncbi:cholesterol oxidase [Fomes fomentarius]|nr:cholesterol oxidase [Fomes fomentarius]